MSPEQERGRTGGLWPGNTIHDGRVQSFATTRLLHYMLRSRHGNILVKSIMADMAPCGHFLLSSLLVVLFLSWPLRETDFDDVNHLM